MASAATTSALPSRKPDAPARHRERLRERVELDRDVGRARHLQDRRRVVAVEAEVGVREVVHEQHLVLAREVDHALHELEVDAGGGRVVRERQHDDARPRPRVLPRLEQVVEEVLLRSEPHVAHLGAGEDRAPDVDRVRRARHQRGVARAEQHPHQVREALLGADGVAHLRVGVEVDAELALVEVGDGHPQLRDAPAGRVAVVARVAHRFDQLVDRDVGRRHVGIAEAEVDDVDSPARRASIFRASMIPKTYGGSALIRRNSIPTRVAKLASQPREAFVAVSATGAVSPSPGLARCRDPRSRRARA